MESDYLQFFEQAMSLYVQDQNVDFKRQSCIHSEISNENGRKICLECGELLIENFITDQHCQSVAGMKRRSKNECNIYNDIPSFIPQSIKNVTIEIYQKVTNSKIFRNTSKKAIILACLHLACQILKTPISYYDLIDMFLLKQHEANKGFVILSTNLPKDSIYYIPFDAAKEEEISIHSRLKTLDIHSEIYTEMFTLVNNVFQLIKTRSSITNESQPNSIICGCIYFWTVYLNIQKRPDEFISKVSISKMTLLKVYVAICDVVFKFVMRKFFIILLNKCKPSINEGKKNKLPKNTLYNPSLNVLIFNPFSQDLYIIPKSKSKEVEKVPLDDVHNILEWNMFLDSKYYDTTNIYVLNIKLIKTVKDIYFDFETFNSINNEDGLKLFKSFLKDTFLKDVSFK